MNSPSDNLEVLGNRLVVTGGVTCLINSRTPFTGRSVSYHDNGQLQSKINWKDGEPDGLLETYYDNGQLKSHRNYKVGRLDGLWEEYYDNGELKSKNCYKDDRLTDMSYCEK